MPMDPVKKFRNVIIDRSRNVRYVIYSNKKLDRKALLRQVRYYTLNPDNPKPNPGEKVNIIATEL